jgi:hypothetical protein
MRKDRRNDIFWGQRITGNGTITPTTATCYIYNIVYNCTNAGTTWSLTIQDKAPTPKVLYTIAALVVSTAPIVVLNQYGPIGPMIGGFDVITAGTAGAVNLWINYSQD